MILHDHEISILSADQLNGILELVKECYDSPYTTSDFWNWRYLKNPLWDVRIYGITDKSGRVLAMQPVSLIPFRHGDGRFHAGLLTAAITSNAYQRRGFFRALVMKIVHDLQNEGTRFLFTFPNPLSSKGFAHFPGWSRFTDLQITGRLLLPFVGKAPDNGVHVQQFTIDVAGLNDLVKNATDNMATYATIERSARYLRWRYAENTTADYWIAHYSGNDGYGFAVFRKTVFKKIPVGAVIEFESTSPDVSGKLIQSVIKQLSRLGCLMALRFVSAGDPYREPFRNASFRNVPPQILRRELPVYVYPLAQGEPPVDWLITWGDMDTI